MLIRSGVHATPRKLSEPWERTASLGPVVCQHVALALLTWHPLDPPPLDGSRPSRPGAAFARRVPHAGASPEHQLPCWRGARLATLPPSCQVADALICPVVKQCPKRVHSDVVPRSQTQGLHVHSQGFILERFQRRHSTAKLSPF